MDFLNNEFYKNLIGNSKQSLNQSFNFSNYTLDNFELINSFLVDKVLNTDKTNLLIATPEKDKTNNFVFTTTLISSLHCFLKNNTDKIFCRENQSVLHTETIEKLLVRIFRDDKIILWKTVSHRVQRVQETDLSNYILLRNENSQKIRESFENYKNISNFFINNSHKLPFRNKLKIILVGSKSEIIPRIPDCIPFQYMNRSGEVYPDTPFDPLLIVVNDFKTAKEHFIEKGIPIDTIIFIGDNKYRQSISAISKSSRQEKFNHCIFIGTQDVETGDNFTVLKWKWTLPEIKFFDKIQYQNLSAEIIKHPELSAEILNFANFIDETEKRYDNLIHLKKLLKFIRKVYPITAIHNENRIKERANEIFETFVNEAEELFQDEYYTIDINYKEDFEKLKIIYQNIINLLKKQNPKDIWFKTNENIDFIVVPKSIKNFCEKEISNCLTSFQKGMKVNNLENISELFNKPKQNLVPAYFGLKETKVITLSDFFKKEPDGKTHLFLSLYSNGIYTDILLQKILSSCLKTKILCYEEEAKAMQFYLQSFQRNNELELRSSHREELCGLHYPETQNINNENIDEWIKYLVGFDEQKFTRSDEQIFIIAFEDDTKVKERESKSVYVDECEEHYKEVRHLKKGDRVRIYQNPDIEILHDIIKLTDEKELFSRVDYYSTLWKNSLCDYYKILVDKHTETICQLLDFEFGIQEPLIEPKELLYNELKSNGLSVDKNRLENWMNPDNKTKFPKKHRDILAIIKSVPNEKLKENVREIIALKREYNGRLNKAGIDFSEEINTYIITKEKGKMLNWLSDKHIQEIISSGAPMRTIKEIKKIDEEILD